jgi:Zn-dependent peptidase ImmA (M78 family)
LIRHLFLYELGHLIFHRDDCSREPEELAYSKSRSNIHEKIANTFASYFLIPRHQLRGHKKLFRRFVPNFSDINWIKREFGVSASAFILALKDEGYIDQKNYGFLKKRLNEMGFEEKEPQPISPIKKNQRIKSTLKRLYLGEKVTTNKVAELLSLNDKEARLLVMTWAEENDGDRYTSLKVF